MERMLAVLVDHPAAAFAGLVGAACLAASPLFRTRSMMLAAYAGNDLAFVLHYALLDDWSAVAMNGVIAAQTAAALGLAGSPRQQLGHLALMTVMAAIAALTWQGLPSLLSAAAALLSMLGRMHGKDTLLRALLLAALPFWAGHDVLVGSLPGLIADLLGMTTGAAMMLWRAPAIQAPA
jgi:hypothetical protein